MLDALDEGLPLLEGAVNLTTELGLKAYLPLWKVHFAEGLLAAGERDRAKSQAVDAFELALAHQEDGHRAWALRLLGEIEAQDGLRGVEKAASHFAEALALSQELGARPLRALTELSMGRLYRRAGMLGEAEEHLTEALALCIEMGLGLWVDRSAAELKQLGHTWIVSSQNTGFYQLLVRALADNTAVEVILDRRCAAQGQDGQPREVQWGGPERRRLSSVFTGLQTRCLAVVQQDSTLRVAP